MPTMTKPKPKRETASKRREPLLHDRNVLKPGDVTCPNGHDLAEALEAKRSKVRGEISASFKKIGRELRDATNAKLRQIWELRQTGKIDLTDPDAGFLSNFVNGYEPLTSQDKIQRAISIVQEFGHQLKASKAKPGTALVPAKRSDMPQTIDVASTPAEKLTAAERKTLTHCEHTIQRGANAFLETGDALTVIQEQRLYRDKYPTFEAYLWEEFHLERSVAYRWIKAASTHIKTSAIADKLSLLITNEAQLRALETVTEPHDMQAVLRRAAKKITPDAKGFRVPTAKILSEAVKEEFTSPADLKREKEAAKERAEEAARLRAAHKRQGIPIDDDAGSEPGMFGRGPQPISVGHLTEDQVEILVPPRDESRLENSLKEATMITAFDKHQRRNTLADIGGWREWLIILRGPEPVDGSDPGYWNGQPNRHARQLAAVAEIVRRLANWQQPGPPGFEGTGSSPREDLANLLHSLAAEISGESTVLHGLTHSQAKPARRAK